MLPVLTTLVMVISAPSVERPTIALVLGGGGTRAFAHVGVIRYLEECRIPIDIVTGTSAGALVGALYAAGYSAAELERIVQETDWGRLLFSTQPLRPWIPFHQKLHHHRYWFNFELGLNRRGFGLPDSLLSGQEISSALSRWFFPVWSIRSFDKLPRPFRAVATNLITGKPVLLSEGSLARAVRASMAHPGLFPPIELDGLRLIDGGPSSNLPVEAARSIGADIVIAVNVADQLLKPEELSDLMRTTNQTITILMLQRVDTETKGVNILITPDLGDQSILNIDTVSEVVERGYQAAVARKRELLTLAEPACLSPPSPRAEPVTLTSIEIQGENRVSESFILHELALKPGELLTPERIEERVTRLHGIPLFAEVTYELTEERGGAKLTIHVQEKRWGPHFFRAGMTWDGEVQGKKELNLLVNAEFRTASATVQNDLQIGSTLRWVGEWRQPVPQIPNFFVAPSASVARYRLDLYRNDSRQSEYEVDRILGGIDGGIEFGRLGEVRAGVRTGYYSAEREVGEDLDIDGSNRTGRWAGSATIDQIDSIFFPMRGVYGHLTVDYKPVHFGGVHRFGHLEFQTLGAIPLGRLSLIAQVQGGWDLSTELPVLERFPLGGFRSIAGLREEEERTENYGIGRAGFLMRFREARTIFWEAIYMQSWAELAGLGESVNDAIRLRRRKVSRTIAVGFDTPLGALSLSGALEGKNRVQFYTSLGRTFGRTHHPNEWVRY